MTSPDGFTFLVKGKVATVSGTLKNSLTSGCRSLVLLYTFPTLQLNSNDQVVLENLGLS